MLQKRSHLRCVMPLVMFVNLPGHISAKSLKMTSLRILEWISATPLTWVEPMTARFAIRMDCSPPSSMTLMLRSLSKSPGYLEETSSRKRLLMSKMICRCRGSRYLKSGTDHFSRASGRIVWLV